MTTHKVKHHLYNIHYLLQLHVHTSYYITLLFICTLLTSLDSVPARLGLRERVSYTSPVSSTDKTGAKT